jgi:hypothetical protein
MGSGGEAPEGAGPAMTPTQEAEKQLKDALAKRNDDPVGAWREIEAAQERLQQITREASV